jgi:hypothetical protein
MFRAVFVLAFCFLSHIAIGHDLWSQDYHDVSRKIIHHTSLEHVYNQLAMACLAFGYQPQKSDDYRSLLCSEDISSGVFQNSPRDYLSFSISESGKYEVQIILSNAWREVNVPVPYATHSARLDRESVHGDHAKTWIEKRQTQSTKKEKISLMQNDKILKTVSSLLASMVESTAHQ